MHVAVLHIKEGHLPVELLIVALELRSLYGVQDPQPVGLIACLVGKDFVPTVFFQHLPNISGLAAVRDDIGKGFLRINNSPGLRLEIRSGHVLHILLQLPELVRQSVIKSNPPAFCLKLPGHLRLACGVSQDLKQDLLCRIIRRYAASGFHPV